MSALKVIKEDCQGFIDNSVHSPIYVNVELLWKNSTNKSIDYFIKAFVSVEEHESIHKCIMKEPSTRKKKYLLGEECIVWLMQKENMSAENYEYYRKMSGRNTKVLDRKEWGFK